MPSPYVLRQLANWWRRSPSKPLRRPQRSRRLLSESLEERRLLAVLSIAEENQLTGTSPDVWDIEGSGTANIQGFAAQFSVNHGERVDFKIDTDSDDYRIDVYRMGYYEGLGARRVATIDPNASLANNQPNPITDFNTGLVDAGNWRVSASWDVPATAVSGVYIAKLTREDGTFGESHIIFIVRDDEGHSDLLMQTSDTNWVAYSDYGGSSLYGNNFLPYGRAYEVSYNRPLTTRDRANTTFFFGAEYPMVRFLEANGYDVSYTTGIDTDRRGAELLEHEVFLSVGHDEYWSGQQRANVEAARDAGVNLAFFSGNEVFWKHRWEDSIAGPTTPYTTLVNYKETHDNAKTDPLDDVWTGTWRDPRFPDTDGGRPENALTGTIFTVNGDSIVGRAITVPAADGKMRFWRNTRVADLTGNQSAVVGDYVLGYEWDEDLDNGFRPAGLIRMSTTTANVSAYIQDYGSTYAPGTATHHLTLYRAPSGALVFGAGTIQYSWGLDSFHDGQPSDTDDALQQATVNLFADMGVQPTTLMDWLVPATMSTDFSAPVSTITAPIDGQVLTSGTAFTIRGTASDLGGGRVGGVEVSVDGGVTWHAAVGRESWTYTWTPRSAGPVNIRTRASDDSANVETAGPGVTINPGATTGTFSFWAASTTPTTVDSGDGSPVELGVRFRVDSPGHITGIRFYKAAANGGPHVGSLWSSDGQLLAQATFTNETGSGWQQVTFDAPVAVAPGMTYVASYTAPNGRYSVTQQYFSTVGVDNGPLHAVSEGAFGTNGLYNYSPGNFPTQSYRASNYWVDVVYSTDIAGDTAAPTVTKFGQAGGGSVVYTNSQFTVTFSEALNPSSVTSNTVVLVKPDNRMIPSGCCPTPGGWCSGCPLLNAVNNTTITATVTYDAASRTATIAPTSPLELATVYTIILNAGGVKDLAGNALEVDTWDSFYTSSQPAPVVSSMWPNTTAPGTVDGGDNAAVELGMRFFADTSGTITGAKFYKAAANTGTHVASLWSSTGQLLARATFVNETASGWQTVNFATPVAVTAGTTYVISYHTNSGHYSVSRNYFGAQVNSGSLHAPASAGVYAYGADSLFPSASYQASNYFVDVQFSTAPAGDTVAPTVVNFNPFEGTSSVSVNPSIKVYFSEDMDASTVNTATVRLLDGGNLAAPVTMTYDQATRTATLTPTSPLANGMTYTIFVAGGSAGVRDTAGIPMAQNTTSSFSTALGSVPDTTAPTITSFSPASGATGVSTTTPINIVFSETLNAATVRSNTVYLLRGGNTLVTSTLTYNAATRTATITPAAALEFNQSYTIYVLGGPSGVKDLADNAMLGNVPSVFTTVAAPADTTAPTVSTMAPSGSAVAINSPVTVTFSEALSASSVTATNIQLRNTASGAVIATTLSYTPGSNTVTLTPTASLANSTGYTIFVQGGSTGIKDVAGNALAANATGTFTTVAAADTTAPTVTGITPASGSNSVAVNAALTVTFSEAMNASTISTSTVFLQGANNAVVATTVSYNASTRVATLTPTSSLANSTSYSIVVKGGSSGVKDVAGNALAADVTSTFTTVSNGGGGQGGTTSTIWSASTTPGTVDGGDNAEVELGMRFSSTVSGYITGVRFYKSAANTGTHTGSLWTNNGQLLATGTFTGETASGWQQLTFATPVAITANTTYIASYHTTTGHYSVNRSYFSSQYTSGSLRVPANGGVYKYGATGAPTSSYQGSNYWVDVVLSTTPPVDTTAPTVTNFAPAANSNNVATSASATVTFSEALTATTVTSSTVFLRGPNNAVVPTTLTYNATARTVTLTPSAALANSTTYTIVVVGGASGVKDAAGNALAANATASFTTAAVPVPGTPTSLWPANPTPGTVDSGDGAAVELGVRFTASVNGYISGVRFYKSAANTGTHTANLWNANGQLLATATFTNETGSGWQQVNFATPVAITADTTYVVSYYTTVGHYAVTRSFFASAFSSGQLRVAANGGVYKYGTSGFPSSSYQGSNYWVDPVFVPLN